MNNLEFLGKSSVFKVSSPSTLGCFPCFFPYEEKQGKFF